jgi:hypothetical protein
MNNFYYNVYINIDIYDDDDDDEEEEEKNAQLCDNLYTKMKNASLT